MTRRRNHTTFISGFIFFLFILPNARPHGLLTKPNQRGALASSKYIQSPVNESAPQDYYSFFPAGEKRSGDAGSRSQVVGAGPNGWTPFEPMKHSYVWPFGVCGDTVDGDDHLRGGRYYNGGQTVTTVLQGGLLSVELAILANHQGYMELHVCDVEKCGGEISEQCFHKGHCWQLQRAIKRACENGSTMICGPIDPRHPGRWYFPCGNDILRDRKGWEPFGNNRSIMYRLPEDLHCDHCVLQWYWAAAHRCNDVGMINYFTGNDAPQWGHCVGAPGSVGGFNKNLPVCGRSNFPQEYVQCADIRIVRNFSPASGNSASPTTSPTSASRPSPTVSQQPFRSPAPSYSPTPAQLINPVNGKDI